MLTDNEDMFPKILKTRTCIVDNITLQRPKRDIVT